MTISDLCIRLKGLTPTEADWDDASQSLTDLHSLKVDWDGCGTIPPSPTALLRSVRLLTELKEAGFSPPQRIIPSIANNGSVILEWYFNYVKGRNDYTFCLIEVNREGIAEVFISNGVDPSTFDRLDAE